MRSSLQRRSTFGSSLYQCMCQQPVSLAQQDLEQDGCAQDAHSDPMAASRGGTLPMSRRYSLRRGVGPASSICLTSRTHGTTLHLCGLMHSYLDERLEYKMQGWRGKRSTFVFDEEDRQEADGNQDKAPIKATPLREMKNEQLFSEMQHLQQLLERFLACRPTGLSKLIHHKMLS